MIQGNIILNHVTTYPEALIKFLSSHEELFYQFYKEEQRIDSEPFNLEEYHNPIGNKYSPQCENKIDLLETLISTYKYAGFHCTRLTESEFISVSEIGLKPLSKENTENRLRTVFENNLVSDSTYKELLKNNSSDQGNRKGRIWFTHDTNILKQPKSIGRFFQNWGGEAIYNNHEHREEITNEISKIGSPYILVSSFCYEELSPIKKLSEYIVDVWLSHRHDNYYYNLFDTNIRYNKAVLKSIKFGDQLFNKLTKG